MRGYTIQLFGLLALAGRAVADGPEGNLTAPGGVWVGTRHPDLDLILNSDPRGKVLVNGQDIVSYRSLCSRFCHGSRRGVVGPAHPHSRSLARVKFGRW